MPYQVGRFGPQCNLAEEPWNTVDYRLGTLPARELKPFRLGMIFMAPRGRFPLLSEIVAVWHVSVHLVCRP